MAATTAAEPVPRPGLVARGLARAIRWYQLVHQDRVSPCRFVPSCSTYALEAVSTRGAVRGSALALRRLSRCHPWGGHGYDPVPPARSAHLERVDQRV
jgi:putative membrane protein insertion efficiency factor